MRLFKKSKKEEKNDEKEQRGETPEQLEGGAAVFVGASPAVALGGSRVRLFLIKKPWITEKSTYISQQNKYIFLVATECNKKEARTLVEAIYGVHVVGAQSVRIPGKKRRLGATEGRTPGYKKIIVTLKAGESIDVLPR